MESLPNEMLEIIVRQLTPQDLAHCSAVSRSWYEAMNKDWIWAPYCDSELEEALRTIPNVGTPKFGMVETKTLPICRCKLAFLREKHTWNIWRSQKLKKSGPEKMILNFGNEKPCCIDFFSDTQIVAWYNNKIQILDVSVIPAVVVAETDTLVEVEQYYHLSVVVETDLLLLGKNSTIEVYKVDISKRSITLHLNLGGISFDRHPIGLVKKNLFLFTSHGRDNLKILNLNNGTFLKEEPCPRKPKETEKSWVSSIFVSPTSDFVAVTFYLKFYNNKIIYNKVYVYCLKEFKFLPGPDLCGKVHDAISLHDRWLAVLGLEKVSILNVTESGEVLCIDEIILNSFFTTKIAVCNGLFVFMDIKEQIDGWSVKSHIRVYSPASKTLTTIKKDFEENDSFEVINNKFIAVFCKSKISDSVWKPSECVAVSGSPKCAELSVEEWEMSVVCGWKINSSFTKEIGYVDKWYINHVW